MDVTSRWTYNGAVLVRWQPNKGNQISSRCCCCRYCCSRCGCCCCWWCSSFVSQPLTRPIFLHSSCFLRVEHRQLNIFIRFSGPKNIPSKNRKLEKTTETEKSGWAELNIPTRKFRKCSRIKFWRNFSIQKIIEWNFKFLKIINNLLIGSSPGNDNYPRITFFHGFENHLIQLLSTVVGRSRFSIGGAPVHVPAQKYPILISQQWK